MVARSWPDAVSTCSQQRAGRQVDKISASGPISIALRAQRCRRVKSSAVPDPDKRVGANAVRFKLDLVAHAVQKVLLLQRRSFDVVQDRALEAMCCSCVQA